MDRFAHPVDGNCPESYKRDCDDHRDTGAVDPQSWDAS